MADYINISEIINRFELSPDNEVVLFLGAGASISSGIPSGALMTWDFKRHIYCAENKISPTVFQDLSKKDVQCKIQSYFDSKGIYPELYSEKEYSFYFEKCYPQTLSRNRYIKDKVKNANPSLGYLCLGKLIIEGRIGTIATTNFDDLVEAGVHKHEVGYTVKTLSSVLSNSVGFNIESDVPNIIKLHGDFLLDNIKNTSEEVQALEIKIEELFKEGIKNKCLVVLGYAGNDDSIMNVLENELENIKYGVIWCKIKNSNLSSKAKKFMDIACSKNKLSGIVEIESFDDFMYRLYLTLDDKDSIVLSMLENTKKNLPIEFGRCPEYTDFLKTNTFECIDYPQYCYCFNTSITTWKELRKICKEEIVAGLYKGKVWAFSDINDIYKFFEGKILGKVEIQDISEYLHNLDKSIIFSLFYDIIEKTMVKNGFIKYGKNKYYDDSNKSTYEDKYIYEAISLSLSFTNEKLLMTILPTVYVEKINGLEIDKLEKQYIINSVLSKRYNSKVNEDLLSWTKKLVCDKTIKFNHCDFEIKFNKIAYSANGVNREPQWPLIKCYSCDEPKLRFSYENLDSVAVNQLMGLIKYGPIESENLYSLKNDIKLAVLVPDKYSNQLLEHLNRLNYSFISNSSNKKIFLPEYIGFNKIFRCAVDIPCKNDSLRYQEYSMDKALKCDINTFYKGMLKYIDKLYENIMEFDVLIIYIPSAFKKFRELKSNIQSFDLHDSIKLYCAQKGIKTQFIEERSVVTRKYNDFAKIMWGLSTAIYTKAIGKLWIPSNYKMDTAYVGLSYVQAAVGTKEILIGCSQLFDAQGNGMRLFLRPIKNPQYINKNPFMRKDDARILMSKLKDLFDNSVPTYNLKRVVIHKTTFFTKEEIEGIQAGLAGVENIELIQIQEYTPWRAIRFDSNDFSSKPSGFPIRRGTVISIDANSFLLWTHGAVQHDELAGKNRNYYKNGRGIPAPLYIKRFLGMADGKTIADEILMLTKMNWNSGDSFYKLLPVTLDFSKRLSKMAKQEVAIYDRAYDFRFFM